LARRFVFTQTEWLAKKSPGRSYGDKKARLRRFQESKEACGESKEACSKVRQAARE
jgi:hypothetical protein